MQNIITNAADLNVQSIPESEIEGIARAVLALADKVMAQPGMQERYIAWKKLNKEE